MDRILTPQYRNFDAAIWSWILDLEVNGTDESLDGTSWFSGTYFWEFRRLTLVN